MMTAYEALMTCSPIRIYLFKVNNGNSRTMCEICSKLTIKIPEGRHLFLVFLLLTLNSYMFAGITQYKYIKLRLLT